MSLIELLPINAVGMPFENIFRRDPAVDWPAFLMNEDRLLNKSGAGSWPLIVDPLRAKKVEYYSALNTYVSQFQVTDEVVVSNVVTLTLAATAPEIAFVESLVEENLFHGNNSPLFSAWMMITLPAPIGSIPAGDYPITGLSASLRTISFPYITPDETNTGLTDLIECYPHRTSVSTQAKWYRVDNDAVFTTAGIGNITGLRVRDTIQGHYHIHDHTVGIDHGAYSGMIHPFSAAGTGFNGGDLGNYSSNYGTSNPSGTSTDDDGSHGTPRVDVKTRARGYRGFKYIYAGKYSP